MQSSLLRLAVALLAFGLGITATTLWIAYRTPDRKLPETASGYKYPVPPPHIQAFQIEEPPPPPQPLLPPVPIYGGILNGKAISKPAPAYPAIARAAHASGTVNVEVTVDESGRVISAEAVSGHPLLQHAAVQAAYEARFSPTRLERQPVKVSGTISYNFVPQ